jgi:hypothetical protein
LRRIRHGTWVLAALASPAFPGSPALAASAQRPVAARPLAAGASVSAFDRVPVTAQRIAAAFGVVTSTFRTIAHNREVGGVANSYHLLGRAIDIVRRPRISHAQIAAALRAAGYVLVESLDEGDHSHFAFGPAVTAAAVKAAEQAPAPLPPRVVADEHGSLLADLAPRPRLLAATSRAAPGAMKARP